MGWTLTGSLVENCSCNALCPCWFGVQDLMVMDQGWCDSVLLFRTTGGSSNGVDLGGCTVVVGIDLPGPTMFDGKGTARLYIDESASPDQRRELEPIFRGTVGGPMEVLASLMTSWLPTSYCAIDVQDDGDVLTATVGDMGTLQSSVLKNDAGDAMTVKNAGFAGIFNFDAAQFRVAPTASRWSDPGLPRGFETKSGARATWTWAA